MRKIINSLVYTNRLQQFPTHGEPSFIYTTINFFLLPLAYFTANSRRSISFIKIYLFRMYCYYFHI